MRFEIRANNTWYFLDEEYVPETVFNRERDARLEREDGNAETLFLGDNEIRPLELTFRGRKDFSNTADVLGLRDWLRVTLPQVDRLRYGFRETEIIAAFFEMRYVDTMQSVEVLLKFIPAEVTGL